SHVLMWTGQFRINMWCSILSGVTMPLAFLVAVRGSVDGIALAWVVVFPLVNIPSMVFAFRTIEISVWQWLDSLKPAVAACVIMLIAVFGVRTGLSAAFPLVGLAGISIATGVLVYATVMWVSFRQRLLSMLEVVRAVRDSNVMLGQTTSAVDAPDT